MRCQQCSSVCSRFFNGEVALHFPGLDGLDKPIVWVFPKVSVCTDCGTAQFTIPERELEVLGTGAQVNGVVTGDGDKFCT